MGGGAALALGLFGNRAYQVHANNLVMPRYTFTIYQSSAGTKVIMRSYNVTNPGTPVEQQIEVTEDQSAVDFLNLMIAELEPEKRAE